VQYIKSLPTDGGDSFPGTYSSETRSRGNRQNLVFAQNDVVERVHLNVAKRIDEIWKFQAAWRIRRAKGQHVVIRKTSQDVRSVQSIKILSLHGGGRFCKEDPLGLAGYKLTVRLNL